MSKRVMIVVHVPENNADKIRHVIGDTGGGNLGNYSYCSFSIKGISRFSPNQLAHPSIGQAGQAEVVTEERIEVMCDEVDAPNIVKAIADAHPYEEPTIFAYPLLDLTLSKLK